MFVCVCVCVCVCVRACVCVCVCAWGAWEACRVSAPSVAPRRYPNDFWGWGGEDDALRVRAQLGRIAIRSPAAGSFKDIEAEMGAGGPRAWRRDGGGARRTMACVCARGAAATGGAVLATSRPEWVNAEKDEQVRCFWFGVAVWCPQSCWALGALAA